MRVQLNARNRAFQFEAAAGEKILYAGLRAHAALPYECATGTCGTCKARLVEGRIDDGWPAAPGKKYLKGEGEFLMCQCTALGDISIEAASFVNAADPAARPIQSRPGTVTPLPALTPPVSPPDIPPPPPRPLPPAHFPAPPPP